MLIILILPFYKYVLFLHLFKPFNPLYISPHTSCSCLVRFISRYLRDLIVVMNMIYFSYYILFSYYWSRGPLCIIESWVIWELTGLVMERAIWRRQWLLEWRDHAEVWTTYHQWEWRRGFHSCPRQASWVTGESEGIETGGHDNKRMLNEIGCIRGSVEEG